MNRSGAPANCWLLCLIYVCYLLNHIACTALDGKIPLFALPGITPDISIILLFTFYQPVFYATYDQNFPSESPCKGNQAKQDQTSQEISNLRVWIPNPQKLHGRHVI